MKRKIMFCALSVLTVGWALTGNQLLYDVIAYGWMLLGGVVMWVLVGQAVDAEIDFECPMCGRPSKGVHHPLCTANA